MRTSEQNFYDSAIRRISRLILILGFTGAATIAAFQGIRIGFAFLVGAAVSYLSFWRWQRVVNALTGGEKTRSAWRFVIGIVILGALACVIIKFLGLNVAAAVSGLLVSGAAVIFELVYELIYGSRT